MSVVYRLYSFNEISSKVTLFKIFIPKRKLEKPMYLQNYTVYRLVPMEMGIPMILVLQEQQRYNSTGEVSPLSHW